MLRYILNRLLWSILVIFFTLLATFYMARALPGGPFDRNGTRTLPQSVRENLERKYNLDKPVIEQFTDYVVGVLRGDLGPSYHNRGQTVRDILARTFPVSFQLGILSLLLGLILGLPAGMLSALYHNHWIDHLVSIISVLWLSVPVVVTAPFLIWLIGVQLDLLPVARWGVDYNQFYLGLLPPPTLEFWQHAALPVITIGSGIAAGLARMTRTSLLAVLRQDYVRTAKAKGLHRWSILSRHALRNALLPIVTLLGPLSAGLVTGSFIVEQIFGLPGLGRYFVESVSSRDYPVFFGATLLYSFVLVLANLGVDLLYAILDPRVRYHD